MAKAIDKEEVIFRLKRIIFNVWYELEHHQPVDMDDFHPEFIEVARAYQAERDRTIEQLRKSARAKLTPAEIEALGI